MSYQLIVTGDTNDGDYTTEITYFDEGDSIEYYNEDESTSFIPYMDLINKLAKSLKKGYNWGNSEYSGKDESPFVLYKDVLSEVDIDLLSSLVPSGIHSIKTIELNVITDTKTLFRD